MLNFVTSLASLFPILLLAAVSLLPMLWSRNGLLLGVHVSPEFFASSRARRILRNYLLSAGLIAFFALLVAGMGIAMRHPWLLVAAEAIEIAGLINLGITTFIILRPHRAHPGGVRSALLKEEAQMGTRWLFTTLAALLPLADVAILLAYRWQKIPDRFPIHWGMNGQPNGWGSRTPALVFGPPIMGAALVLLIAALGKLVPRYSSGFEGRPAYLSITGNVLRAGAWLLSLLFSVVGLLPLMSHSREIIPWLAIGPILFAVGLIGWIALRSRRMSDEMARAQDSTPDRYWKAGLFYYNPDDPALMVPKRVGIGYTFNFGHPITWVLLCGFALIPVILPLLVHLGGKR